MSEEYSFELAAQKPIVFVQEADPPNMGNNLKLIWKLNYGQFTKNDFVYTLNHKYARVNGGEGFNHITREYPGECKPTTDWGPAECGDKKRHFANRVIIYITTMTEAGYDALVVTIKNVTLADFNVDPERTPKDIPADKMHFEAVMHCAVIGHIGQTSSATIEVSYTRVDPNRPIDDRNKEKQNVNYASVAIGVVVAVVVLLIVLIVFTKRKSIQKCLKPEKQKNKPEVEEVKANGENEKLAQMQQELA